jgi:diguanylate cyclase (GGDEF)-like protein/PAS domain S-box-containing protein
MNSIATISSGYDLRLVSLSILLAMFASYAALDLAGRVTSAQGLLRIIWISAGAAAMGLGIWAMHYVGMLALRMPIPISYNLPTVLLSLFAAISASAVALFVASRPKLSFWQEVFGSVVMGSGIAAMHYIGMAAMRCAAEIVYDWRIVALSIVLAVVISQVALRLAFRMREEKSVNWRKVLSALLMGSAIPLMHYTGMWAATFRHSRIAPDLTNAISVSSIGLISISACSFLVMGVAIALSMFDRFIALQRGDLNIARERELYFKTMAEAIPEVIWTADPGGFVDYCNRNMLEYSGLTLEHIRGTGWSSSIHPDDLELCLEKWRGALSAGEAYEAQYRLRRSDGTYRWFLCRANPIRDAQGKIVKWCGTCTDIESQKLNEQVLQEQIMERTLQLANANARLQEEMAEKDSARRQLDQEHETMLRDLEQRSERATMLAKMGELLQSSISREEVISVALGFAPKIFPAARGAIVLLNSSRTVAEVAGSWAECQLPAMEFDANACWSLRTGHPHLVYAGDSTARCMHVAGLESSYLCVPILAQGETLGILHLQAKSSAMRLDPAELSFRTTFAGQVGLSIANIKLRDALRTQSIRDALTGLYNRRYLEEILDREIRRAARAQQNLGVILIDLDHFKKFNDAFGHDAGDAVLRETGTALTRGIRAEDFVCRYGGEEFVVILPTANVDAAQARGESLRLKMRELTILYQGKSMGMITISVGVAVFPDHGTTPKELMAAADAALYEAKRNGRDQVTVASTRASEAVEASESAKTAIAWG